jgi:hypothetical protein
MFSSEIPSQIKPFAVYSEKGAMGFLSISKEQFKKAFHDKKLIGRSIGRQGYRFLGQRLIEYAESLQEKIKPQMAPEKGVKLERPTSKLIRDFSYKIRWQIILERDNFSCQYCGRKAPEVRLEVDHVIPVSKGGMSAPSNLRAACWECNIGKGNRLIQVN